MVFDSIQCGFILGYSGVLRVRVRDVRRFSGDSERFRVILSSFLYKMIIIFYLFLILNSWKARAHRDLYNGVLRIFLVAILCPVDSIMYKSCLLSVFLIPRA